MKNYAALILLILSFSALGMEVRKSAVIIRQIFPLERTGRPLCVTKAYTRSERDADGATTDKITITIKNDPTRQREVELACALIRASEKDGSWIESGSGMGIE